MSLDIVGAVLSGVLGGRRKRSRNVMRFLGHGGGGFINASTLMAAAGLVWGAYESWQAQAAASGAPTSPAGSGAAGPPPPLAGVPAGLYSSTTAPPSVRLIRLAVAAANADGSMSDSERSAVVAQARAEGASETVTQELERPGTLVEIVAGVSEPAEKAALYVIAFAIVRADEQVSGSERIFLAQLASLLGLDPQTVAALEKTVGERIDAEGA